MASTRETYLHSWGRTALRGLACLAAALAVGGTALAQERPVRVVYHFSEGAAQASRGLEFLRNHLDADPNAQIIVVAHAAGVDFLMKGAKTEKGNEFRAAIEDLDLQGVKFRVCEITLRERNLQRAQFVSLAGFVPSGVAELARLQQREGFAYIRP
ncbi:MAG: DsrE family protein [Betaproteobacteria bacterium]|nr:DsrE family protein [Betaproteobacteria bacterium]